MTTREYAKNLFSAWSDDDFLDQPIFDKLFFQVLNGQRAVNAAGIQPINFTRWRKAMRDGDRLPTIEELQAALDRMEARGFIYVDHDTGEVLIRSRIRNDGLDKQPTVFLSALRLVAVIDSPKFAHVLAGELDRIECPEVNGTGEHGKKLRAALSKAWPDAKRHVTTLAARYHQPAPIPNRIPNGEGYAIPNGIPNTIGYSRPAETIPNPIPNPIGSPIPSVSGSVSVVTSPPVGTYVGGTRTRDDQPATPQPLTPADEPPRHCPAHPDGTEAPCGPCRGYRKLHDRWQAQQAAAEAEAARTAAETQRAARAQAAQAAQALIDACPHCDPDGYRGNRVCDHHDRTDTTRAGIAAARAALAHKTTPTNPETDTNLETPHDDA